MILGALVRADRGAIASKFIRLSIEVFHRLVGDHRVVFNGIFFARLVDHFTSDVGAPLRHTDCDVEVAEGHDGDDERKVPAHILSAQFKGMGWRVRGRTHASKKVRKYMTATPKSTNIGTTWNDTCSKNVLIAFPLLSALSTSPVFLPRWKSSDNE